MQRVLIILFLHLISAQQILSQSNSIDLTITNIQDEKGKIQIAMYNSKNDYLTTRVTRGMSFQVKQTGMLTCRIDSLPNGQYAISVYHDVNGDNKLNLNTFGMPKEPTGFSQNPKSLIGPPKYKRALIHLKDDSLQLQIELRD